MNSVPRNRSVRSKSRIAAFATAALAALVFGLGAPAADEVAGHSVDRPSTLNEVLLDGGGKRYDAGLFDMISVNPMEPVGWILVVDATSDGNGTQYGIYHSSYVTPGPANPFVSWDIVLDQVNDPLTLSAALDHIVATYPHVSHASELKVHKQVITTIQ